MTRAGVDMQGVAVTLLDTAGLRSAADAVERIGVARARAAAAAADVVVLVYDAQVPPRSAWPLLQVLLRTQSNVIVQSSAGPVAASWRVHPAPGSVLQQLHAVFHCTRIYQRARTRSLSYMSSATQPGLPAPSGNP